jgi:hypothetical protein
MTAGYNDAILPALFHLLAGDVGYRREGQFSLFFQKTCSDTLRRWGPSQGGKIGYRFTFWLEHLHPSFV